MKKILLIEDNEDIRNNTAEILQLSNYKVITAENGKTGIEKALEHKPDLIICDIMMPTLDGFGVLHAIHRNEPIKNTPFIFLTAKTERADIRKGMELGADDFITKPFTGTELLNAVDSRIKKMDLLKQEISPGIEGLRHLMQPPFTKNIIQSITEGRDINKYKKKQTVYAVNNHPYRLYYIIKGKVKAFKSNDLGKELVTDIFCEGDFFGYVPLLEGTIYNETTETLEETELAILPKEDFDELVNNNPDVAKKFIQLLAKNIADKENQLLGLAYNSLRKKVAEALILLQKKYRQTDGEKIIIDISRENLATVAGTATESLIRTLSEFRTEKLIEINNGKITLIDQEKLEHLLN